MEKNLYDTFHGPKTRYPQSEFFTGVPCPQSMEAADQISKAQLLNGHGNVSLYVLFNGSTALAGLLKVRLVKLTRCS